MEVVFSWAWASELIRLGKAVSEPVIWLGAPFPFSFHKRGQSSGLPPRTAALAD